MCQREENGGLQETPLYTVYQADEGKTLAA